MPAAGRVPSFLSDIADTVREHAQIPAHRRVLRRRCAHAVPTPEGFFFKQRQLRGASDLPSAGRSPNDASIANRR